VALHVDNIPLAQIAPRLNQRALVVGQTGSGKSFLADRLVQIHAAQGKYIVAHDGKDKLPEESPFFRTFDRFTTLDDATRSRSRRILYAPNRAEEGDEEKQNAFFEWIYRRRNTTLYVDEVGCVTYGTRIPDSYRAILTRGRQLGLACISGSQRPMDIPQLLLSEAEHYYVFRLQLPQDRKKVKAIFEFPDLKTLPPRYFYYAQANGAIIGPTTLKL